MSVELEKPVSKPRNRRKPKDNDVKRDEENEENINNVKNDDKILNDLRQSIEKTDNSRTIENNLFDPEVPDKMSRRSHKRRPKKGEDNLTFEPDNNNYDNELKEIDKSKEEPEPSRTRRRRRPKDDEMETKNEELSVPESSNVANNIDPGLGGDTAAPRRRRVRKKDRNDNLEMVENTVESTSGYRDPMTIEDDGRILSILIHRTDRLKTDINAIHPMIRVHIMDTTTGRLMMKQNKDRKVTTCNEDIEKVTMILPMMTQPFDFKSHRLTIPAWEEALLFNENANYLMKNPNAIFLFEVIDLNSAYSVNKTYSVQQQSSGFHHIAWGFLLPVGANGFHNTDKKVRLQLYENGPLQNNQEQYSANVFQWWKYNLRRPYPSTLYVTVSGIRINPQTTSMSTSRSMFPSQMEGSNLLPGDTDYQGLGPSSGRQTFHMLQQWKRLPGQMCHIPNTPQLKFITSSGGTSALGFSPDGDWLACGAIDSSDNFPVFVYSMTAGSTQPFFTLAGHNRIVHALAWCPKSQLLASASADGTVRVHNIAARRTTMVSKDQEVRADVNVTEETSTLNETESVRIIDKRVLCHPCFVYCVVFHPRSSAILVTAGYDKIIRIWDVAVNRKDILQQLDLHKGYINSVVFSSDGHFMYSGDSKGVIHCWKTPILELSKHSPYKEKWSRDETIEERDLAGIIINHMMLTPTGKRILVHSRDGNIRLMDLQIKAMVLKFHGIFNSEKNIHSCLSPCGSFLFSGTEDYSEGSQAFVWNALTGDHVAIYKDLNLPGPVNAIDYHPKCHMVAFSSIGSEGSIVVYTYSSENARLEMGYQSGNSSPNSPRLTAHPKINYDNMTKLEETQSRRLEEDKLEYSSFQTDYDRRKNDRLSRIMNTINSVKEMNQSMRRANQSLDRDAGLNRMYSTDGYGSGPEDKGRLMRSNKKATTGLQSIPMTLNATSSSKANFTFKPPPAVKHREQSSKYLGEVVAIFDYDAQRSDELSFARGEVIKIVFRDGKNWLLGEAKDGHQGYLPANYVTGDEFFADNTNSVSEKSDSPLKHESRKARFNASEEVVDFQSADPPINASLKSSRRQRRRPSVQSTDNT